MTKYNLVHKRILICGDRNWTDKQKICAVLQKHLPASKVIPGCARGADTLEGEVARELDLSVLEFPALWDQYGRAAGPIRN